MSTSPAPYHGPKTLVEAKQRIDDLIYVGKIDIKTAVKHITDRMKQAGYKSEITRIKKYYKR